MFFLIIFVLFSVSHARYNTLDESNLKLKSKTDAGDPLYLTPYIEANSTDSIEKARKLASVTPFVGKVKSYSGYLTISLAYSSNFFFWFFESENNPKTAPILLWLHGGPGLSSLMALFEENGPYRINENGNATLAKISWTKNFNVLYIDNPVGAGYSYTDYSGGYSESVEECVTRLYKILVQFFQLFYEYKKNPFYLTGQSYAGKYVPKLASVIHKENKYEDNAIKINLKGLFIGCGYIDPVNQLHYSNFLHEFGIFDQSGADAILDHETDGKKHIKNNNYYRASYHYAYIGFKLYGSGYKKPFVDVANPDYDLSSYDRVEAFIQRNDIRKAIHVGSKEFNGQIKVVWNFKKDFYNSSSSTLSEMLKHYKVLLYSGQFDMIIPPTQTQKVIQNLSWSEKEKFINAKRTVWKVNGEPAGYKKSYDNLTHVFVREANHIIIRCQQKWLFDLITTFVAETK